MTDRLRRLCAPANDSGPPSGGCQIRRWACLLVTTVSLVLGGCEVVDVSEILTLHTDAVTHPTELALRLPRVSRSALDLAIINEGSAEAEFVVRAQMQTSGNSEDEACSLFEGASVRTVTAVASTNDPGNWTELGAPVIREVGDGVRIQSPGTVGATGLIEFRVPRSSQYRVVTALPIVSVRVVTLDGVDVVPASYVDDVLACSRASTNVLLALDEGAYFMEFGWEASQDGDPLLLVAEECSNQRLVSRTCPGASSDVVERTITVAAGQRQPARLSESELGVGDVVVVQVGCQSACVGTMEFTLLTRELECRATSDCTGQRTCSSEGYCLVPPESGCNGGGTRTPGAFAMLLVALLGVLSWVRGHRSPTARGRGSGALVLIFVLLAPAFVAAEERRVDVFFATGVQSRSFTGDPGRYSSGGFGAAFSQGVWVGRVGFHLTLSTDAWLTTQPAPPVQRGTQSFMAALGPRLGTSVPGFRLWTGIDYVNLTMISNALVRYTGAQRSYSAPALSVGVRWDALAPLYLEVSPHAVWFVTMDSRPVLWGIQFHVGILGGR
jgi:hypothetical protein